MPFLRRQSRDSGNIAVERTIFYLVRSVRDQDIHVGKDAKTGGMLEQEG